MSAWLIFDLSRDRKSILKYSKNYVFIPVLETKNGAY